MAGSTDTSNCKDVFMHDRMHQRSCMVLEGRFAEVVYKQQNEVRVSVSLLLDRVFQTFKNFQPTQHTINVARRRRMGNNHLAPTVQSPDAVPH